MYQAGDTCMECGGSGLKRSRISECGNCKGHGKELDFDDETI